MQVTLLSQLEIRGFVDSKHYNKALPGSEHMPLSTGQI